MWHNLFTYGYGWLPQISHGIFVFQLKSWFIFQSLIQHEGCCCSSPSSCSNHRLCGWPWERWVTLASCYIQHAWLWEVSYTGFLFHTVCMAERGELHWLPVTYSMHGWERWVTLASCYIQHSCLREVTTCYIKYVWLRDFLSHGSALTPYRF